MSVRNKSYPYGGMVLTEYPAYPDNFKHFVETNHRHYHEAYEHRGDVRDVTIRNEFAYTANGLPATRQRPR